MSRIRNFLFTLNNPSEAEKQFWLRLANNEGFRQQHDVQYLVFQEEKGENGTLHLQGYVERTIQQRLRQIKSLFGSRMHIEKRRGSQGQAIAYCKKAETRVLNGCSGEGGDAKKRGKDKLSVVAPLLRDGATLTEISTDYPATYIKFGPKLRSYYLHLQGSRNWAPEVIIYCGKTGTGKSANAKSKFPNAFWVPWPRSGGWWWPQYEGQETIILDEFRHQIKYDSMLNLLDRYPFDIQEKGNNMNMIAKRIVITTNIDPARWYPNLADDVKAPLLRRFKDFAKIYDFADNSTWNHPIMQLRTTVEEGPDELSFAIPEPRIVIPAGVGDTSQGNGFLGYGMDPSDDMVDEDNDYEDLMREIEMNLN